MNIKKVKTKNGEIRWEAYGYVSGRSSKQIRRRFEKRIDAENFVTEHKLEKIENVNIPKALFSMDEHTFEEESKYWLEHRVVSLSPGHQKRSKDALKKHILPKIGKLKLSQINPVVFSKYRTMRFSEGAFAPSTINRETEVMMAILNFSVKQRRIPFNPASGFTKLFETREEVQFWENAEAAEFLRFADLKYPTHSPKRWIYVVYLLALNTALRAGEIWGLKPKDLVQGEELLHLERQFDRVVKCFRTPKGKKSRYVPCNSILRVELKLLIETRKIENDETFFQTETRKPIDHDNFVYRQFERDIAEAKVKRIRFHDLRHSGTTLMIASGLDIKTVQEICGHKDIATTMRYIHLLGDSIKKAARTFSVTPSLENSISLKVVTK